MGTLGLFKLKESQHLEEAAAAWLRWASTPKAFGLSHEDSKDEAGITSLTRPQEPMGNSAPA